MTAAQLITKIEADTRWQLEQAAREGAALRGELGLDAQLLAMSEVYKQLKAEGKDAEAREIKNRAIELKAGA